MTGSNCLVCGGTYGPSSLPGLSRCTRCGFVSADLSIPDAELDALYGEDYFHGQEYLDYVAEQHSLRLNFRRRIAALTPHVLDWPKSDVFEIGCAYGFFLDEIRNEVQRASGIDISPAAVRHAREVVGVEAVQGDYVALDLGRRVDVIALWDTVEHLRRPDLFLEKAAADLKPGGVVAITTGDIESLVARARGKRWRMIHPPTHLHYFSARTLSMLLDRLGFDVVHLEHPGNSRRLRSILYIIAALKLKRPALYEALKGFPLFDLAVTVNLFDIMYVVARRRPE